jgi:hypothetical protein
VAVISAVSVEAAFGTESATGSDSPLCLTVAIAVGVDNTKAVLNTTINTWTRMLLPAAVSQTVQTRIPISQSKSINGN